MCKLTECSSIFSSIHSFIHSLLLHSETGGLTTRHNRRIKSHQVIEEDNLSQSNVTPITSEMITPTTPQGTL